MRALTTDELEIPSGGVFVCGNGYSINGLERSNWNPRTWGLIDFGRAGGVWVQEYYQPPAPGSGKTSIMDLVVAVGEFMASVAVPAAEPTIVITGPNLLKEAANWASGK